MISGSGTPARRKSGGCFFLRSAAKLESNARLIKPVSNNGVRRSLGASRLTEADWARITRNDLSQFHVNDKRRYYREEYLKSDHWLKLRAEKLRASPRCENCGSLKRLEPHHLDYRNLYDVGLDDLVTLCRKCHCQEHERLRKI